jgi:hypothetical protein
MKRPLTVAKDEQARLDLVQERKIRWVGRGRTAPRVPAGRGTAWPEQEIEGPRGLGPPSGFRVQARMGETVGLRRTRAPMVWLAWVLTSPPGATRNARELAPGQELGGAKSLWVSRTTAFRQG